MNEESPPEVAAAETAEPVVTDYQAQMVLDVLRSEQNLVNGIAAGLLSSVVGAGVWAGIAIMSEYQIGWIAVAIDHASRLAVGFAVFKRRPSSEEVTAAMGRMMVQERVRPKHLIVDQGREFKCEHFEDVWCETRNILPRFGAVGRHGSVAVVAKRARPAAAR